MAVNSTTQIGKGTFMTKIWLTCLCHYPGSILQWLIITRNSEYVGSTRKFPCITKQKYLAFHINISAAKVSNSCLNKNSFQWWPAMYSCHVTLVVFMGCWINDASTSMMTSSNGNNFRVTGPLCGEFTGHRWIPLTKASDAELWCFLYSVPD